MDQVMLRLLGDQAWHIKAAKSCNQEKYQPMGQTGSLV
jgi:hypothetical protein